jgi:chromosome segregation ATPase
LADADVLKRRVERVEAALAQAEIDIADLRRELAEALRQINGLRLRLPPTQAVGKVHSPF